MISVSHMTALDSEPERMVDAAVKAGFQGVGLRIFPPRHAPDQYPVTGDWPRIRSLRARAEDQGIRIFEAESFGIGPDFQRDDYARALEAAEGLNAGVIVSAGIDDDLDRLAENYAWLAEASADHGIRMAMEFMPYRGMRTLSDALSVHAKVNHPNAKLLIDAVHLSRSGATVADLAAIPDRSIIGHFHICDAPATIPATDAQKMAESREARLYPGQGGLPLRDMLALLPADCSISLEAPHRDQQAWSVEERVMDAGRVTLGFLNATDIAAE
jgi:sugar phosphate isomerase/epimerase